MTVEWGTVYARLLEQGLLVMGRRALNDRIIPFTRPRGRSTCRWNHGLLNQSVLTTLIEAYQARTALASSPQTSANGCSNSVQRTSRGPSPRWRTEPVNLLRNGTPDWAAKDFPELATDVDVDITVHFDITGIR